MMIWVLLNLLYAASEWAVTEQKSVKTTIIIRLYFSRGRLDWISYKIIHILLT